MFKVNKRTFYAIRLYKDNKQVMYRLTDDYTEILSLVEKYVSTGLYEYNLEIIQ